MYPSGSRHCGSQQMSIGNEHTASAYSHRAAHHSHKWLLLKIFHAFANLSMASIRGLVPRANRYSLKITRKPTRMDCVWH